MQQIHLKEDKLQPAEIKKNINTSFIGREIVYYKKIDSTNRIAAELANNGADEGTIILTDEQTKGRGRLNRTWISVPYTNILMSLIIRPSIKIERSFYLTMIASIALVKAIKQTTGLMTLIKWPNDIYCNNKKTAGVLTELNINQKKINNAIIGIGLNVNSDLSSVEEIKSTATSLMIQYGEKISRTRLLCSILESIEEQYLLLKQNKFEKIRKKWIENSLIIGKHVVVSLEEYSEFGIAESLAEDGSLVLINENGERKHIMAGDVSLRLTE